MRCVSRLLCNTLGTGALLCVWEGQGGDWDHQLTSKMPELNPGGVGGIPQIPLQVTARK